MKKYMVHHNGRDATYMYFLSPHGKDMHVLSILYYDRKSNWINQDTIILNYRIHHVLAVTEADALTEANHWVKANLGPDFHVDEV